MDELKLTIAYNHSDQTFGWKGAIKILKFLFIFNFKFEYIFAIAIAGYKNAFTLYYMHPTEPHITEKHSFPMVPGLTPIMNLMSIQTKLLGAPFSECNMAPHYTSRGCVYSKMLEKIMKVCECYPPYVHDDIDAVFRRW